MDLIYTEYNPIQHLDSVVRLEQYLWEGFSEEKLKEVFQWKYPDETQIRNAFVTLDGERVVAFRGFFINTYQYNGQTFPVAVLGDAVTDPAYRRRGIFSKLTKHSLNYFQQHGLFAVLALSSNEKSSGGYKKLGWSPFARKRINIHPIWTNIFPFIQRFQKQSENRWRKEGFEIEISNSISELWAERLADYCSSLYQENTITLLKDKHFWLYRYKTPQWSYRFIILSKNDKIRGYACYMESVGQANGIKHVKILDIAASDNSDFNRLIQAIENRVSCRLMLIYSTSLSINEWSRIRKKFPITKYEHNHNASDEVLVKSVCTNMELAKPQLWSLGYVDMDSM